MLCYKDMTFCSFYKECTYGETCKRAYTDEVKQKAIQWWGNENAPICFFTQRPNCFKAISQ